MTDTVPLPPPVRSGCYPYNAEDMRTYAAAVSAADNAALRAKNERLRNDLADALDCKAGAGPTALSSVLAERDALRKRVEELEAARREVERLLTDLQPHIAQACYPGHAAFIDNYVDPALEIARALSQPKEPK